MVLRSLDAAYSDAAYYALSSPGPVSAVAVPRANEHVLKPRAARRRCTRRLRALVCRPAPPPPTPPQPPASRKALQRLIYTREAIKALMYGPANAHVRTREATQAPAVCCPPSRFHFKNIPTFLKPISCARARLPPPPRKALRAPRTPTCAAPVGSMCERNKTTLIKICKCFLKCLNSRREPCVRAQGRTPAEGRDVTASFRRPGARKPGPRAVERAGANSAHGRAPCGRRGGGAARRCGCAPDATRSRDAG